MSFLWNYLQQTDNEVDRSEQVVTPSYTSDDEWIYVNEKRNNNQELKYLSYAECVKSNSINFTRTYRHVNQISYDAWIEREQKLLQAQRELQCPTIHEEISYDQIDDLPSYEDDYVAFDHVRWVRSKRLSLGRQKSNKNPLAMQRSMKDIRSFQNFHVVDRPVQVNV